MNYLLKYKKYKNKYMYLKKQLGGAASTDPTVVSSAAASTVPTVVSSAAASSADIVNKTYSIANTELNQLWQSIGFEFEYAGYYIDSTNPMIINALDQAHNKLKITLPNVPEFQDVELEIGNDGPYETDRGEIYHNLEMNVTFKNKTKCQNIYECYNKALDICKIFLHDSFVRVNNAANPAFSIFQHKSVQLSLKINKHLEPFYKNNCLSQCTITVPYNNIKTIF